MINSCQGDERKSVKREAFFNSFDIYLINPRKQGHKKTLNGVIMSVNYVIKLLSHEHKNARSDANTEKTDPQIFSDINCKHLGLIVLSDVDSGRKFNVCMINLNFLAASVQKP